MFSTMENICLDHPLMTWLQRLRTQKTKESRPYTFIQKCYPKIGDVKMAHSRKKVKHIELGSSEFANKLEKKLEKLEEQHEDYKVASKKSAKKREKQIKEFKKKVEKFKKETRPKLKKFGKGVKKVVEFERKAVKFGGKAIKGGYELAFEKPAEMREELMEDMEKERNEWAKEQAKLLKEMNR